MRKLATVFVVCALALPLAAADKEKPEVGLTSKALSGLKFRSIGPALMSGRIADIAVHPTDFSTWYVAVGSGGVWKTINSGTTWKPIFDGEKSYSIGCVVLDPSNPEIVWVGTGENVGGRHVGFGDGVYRSLDGGSSWKNMGLGESQHISEIIVDPTDSNTVYAASQGPLWSAGGERGLFKTADGGESWENVLSDGEWTGVTDVVMDSRDPKVLYAATWQHHRTVAAVIDGGPESGIHKTTDGGETWTKLGGGLPKGNLGKIGLTISPQNPDVVYAVIELDNREGGTWRSANRGASWEKRSDAVSGGTGPHYYQELEASPHAFDRIYIIDVRMQISDDGGKNFRTMNERTKHSDNHALAFRTDDPDYLLVGTDGGLYESFDLAKTWRFVANLPVTQFYKLAVDDDEPFYNIYGGTQDNNTQGGPSRTNSVNGIRNADWYITLSADGHQPATEPGNPDILYSESQQGVLHRVDRTTGGVVYIQPQPEPGDPPERFNWDSPILVSPHSPTRLYFASQRVWRSDNRGDEWRPVSPDLTKNEDRILLPVMGRQWSSTAPWDLFAMSKYNTITSLAESPVQEGLLWAGTDDGLIQVSADGGENWTAIPVGNLAGVPATAFVNDIKADFFEADTAYVCLDNHKYGDFKPYLLKTTDRGATWTSIAGDLPDRHLVWRLVQDHVKKELLFVATEFGIFFTVEGGGRWIELSGGVPTISFRDLAIQRRENDLVGASFGRGFYVLDDYSPLREVSEQTLDQEATLFPVRETPWYIQRRTLGGRGQASQGGSYYIAENPPYGAVFTYHLSEGLKSLEDNRRETEKKLEKEWKDTPYSGYDELERERRQPKPTMVFTISDASGEVVRSFSAPAKKGFNRVAWNLTYPTTSAIRGVSEGGWGGGRGSFDANAGFMVPPGTYTATLSKKVDGVVTQVSGPVEFEVTRVFEGALDGTPPVETAAFMQEVAALQRSVSAASQALALGFKTVEYLEKALARTTVAPGALDGEVEEFKQKLYALDQVLSGNRSRRSMGEPISPTISTRLRVASRTDGQSDYGPTAMHRRAFEIAAEEFAVVEPELRQLLEVELPALEEKMEAAGVPWTPGRPLPSVQ
jgi:photosystem II stability/assembly factor-like uncharacterized protein